MPCSCTAFHNILSCNYRPCPQQGRLNFLRMASGQRIHQDGQSLKDPPIGWSNSRPTGCGMKLTRIWIKWKCTENTIQGKSSYDLIWWVDRFMLTFCSSKRQCAYLRFCKPHLQNGKANLMCLSASDPRFSENMKMCQIPQLLEMKSTVSDAFSRTEFVSVG